VNLAAAAFIAFVHASFPENDLVPNESESWPSMVARARVHACERMLRRVPVWLSRSYADALWDAEVELARTRRRP